MSISEAIEKIFPLIEETYKYIDFHKENIEAETEEWYDRALEFLELENGKSNTIDEVIIFYFGLRKKLLSKYHNIN